MSLKEECSGAPHVESSLQQARCCSRLSPSDESLRPVKQRGRTGGNRYALDAVKTLELNRKNRCGPVYGRPQRRTSHTLAPVGVLPGRRADPLQRP